MSATATPGKVTAEDLTREEWVIANTIVNAIVCANAVDCSDSDNREQEYSTEARNRIKAFVVEKTSHMQRDSLISLCPND